MSLVMSTGADIQNYIFSLIRSDAASIYGSAYQDGLAKFPQIGEWLFAGFHWSFLLTATTIVIVIPRRADAQRIFVSSIPIFFFGLAAYDLTLAVYANILSGEFVLENLIGNLFGAGLLASIFVGILVAAELCFKHASGPMLWRRLVVAGVIVILGMCLNSASFYIVGFFYKPTPAKMLAVVEAPISGTVGSRDRNQKKNVGEDADASLQLFPTKLRDTTLRWIAPGESVFSADWKLRSDSLIFDATIEFYADCFGDSIETATSTQKNQIKLAEVKELTLMLDQGFTEFRTMSREGSGHLETFFGDLSTFWLDLEDNSKKVRVTQFVDKDAYLTVKNTDDHLAFYVTAPLLKSESGGIAVSSRKISLVINGKRYAIELEKPRGDLDQKNLVCRSIDPNDALRKDRAALQGARNSISALVRVVKRATTASVYGIENSILKVIGGNGWVHATSPINKHTPRDHTGRADLIAFKGNIASLDIDGSSIIPRTTDNYTAYGEFDAQFESATKLRFSGKAKALWKNGHRLNQTRWEQLTWAQQAFIGTFLLSIFGSIAAYVTLQIRTRLKISWWSNLRSSDTLS